MFLVLKNQDQYFFSGYKVLKIGVGLTFQGTKKCAPKGYGSQECAPMDQELTHNYLSFKN